MAKREKASSLKVVQLRRPGSTQSEDDAGVVDGGGGVGVGGGRSHLWVVSGAVLAIIEGIILVVLVEILKCEN